MKENSEVGQRKKVKGWRKVRRHQGCGLMDDEIGAKFENQGLDD